MNKNLLTFLVIVGLALLIYLLRTCSGQSAPSSRKGSRNSTANKVNRDKGFDRRVSYIEYSQHAKCRMKCRHITQEEVKQAMQEGNINYNKSDLNNSRCPRYAIEDQTADGQHVRIIFAQCNENTTVVTVIDLDTDFECHCPGDDNAYKNN